MAEGRKGLWTIGGGGGGRWIEIDVGGRYKKRRKMAQEMAARNARNWHNSGLPGPFGSKPAREDAARRPGQVPSGWGWGWVARAGERERKWVQNAAFLISYFLHWPSTLSENGSVYIGLHGPPSTFFASKFARFEVWVRKPLMTPVFLCSILHDPLFHTDRRPRSCKFEVGSSRPT